MSTRSLRGIAGLASWLRALALFAVLAAMPLLAPAAESASEPGAARGQAAEAERQQTQPLNSAPLWRDVRSGDPDENQTTQVRGVEANVLVQTQGEVWGWGTAYGKPETQRPEAKK